MQKTRRNTRLQKSFHMSEQVTMFRTQFVGTGKQHKPSQSSPPDQIPQKCIVRYWSWKTGPKNGIHARPVDHDLLEKISTLLTNGQYTNRLLNAKSAQISKTKIQIQKYFLYWLSTKAEPLVRLANIDQSSHENSLCQKWKVLSSKTYRLQKSTCNHR